MLSGAIFIGPKLIAACIDFQTKRMMLYGTYTSPWHYSLPITINAAAAAWECCRTAYDVNRGARASVAKLPSAINNSCIAARTCTTYFLCLKSVRSLGHAAAAAGVATIFFHSVLRPSAVCSKLLFLFLTPFLLLRNEPSFFLRCVKSNASSCLRFGTTYNFKI